MANFDPSVPAIQPNGYLSSFSQGTDRASLQPLAEVPKLSEKYVSPDYKANTSTGQGIADLGKLETVGVSLATDVIKQNVDESLNSGIKKIQDSFGVAAATDIESGVADAVGKGGAEGTGTSLTDTQGKPPMVLQKLGTQVDGLTEAYNQGMLSNSAYYAKMNAYVTQVKQQFPGFSDDVDQMAKEKIGVNPANALRSAIQDDVAKLAAKVSSTNDKWTTYENTNTQYIHTRWPNYEQLKQDGTAPSQAEVKNVVGNLQARDYGFSSKQAALATDTATNAAIAVKAEDIATQKASDIAGHLVTAIPNQMGIKTPEDFTQVLNDVRNGQRPPLTPDEKQQLTGVIATMKQQYGINFDKFVNANVDQHGLPQRPLASYTSPQKLSAIRDQGMQSIKDMEDGLINDKTGILAQTAIHNAATLAAGEGDFIRRAPVAVAVAAGRKFYGDQGIMDLVSNQPMLQSNILEGFRQWNQGKIAQGDGSLRETLDTYKAEKINDGTLNRAAIGDTVNTILHADKMADQTAGANAVQHAYGPNNRTLLDAFDTKNQVDVFGQMLSKPIIDKVSKMDGKSKSTVINWANESFPGVYEAQAAEANQAAINLATQYTNTKIVYDPKSANFTFESSFRLPPFAQAKLNGLNSAINSMKEVFKMQGKDPTEALTYLLPVSGIDPGSPIYKALQAAQPKENNRAGSRYNAG